MAAENYTTAAEYIKEQHELEKEAVKLMPYEPDKCTYMYGPMRQMVFACLTCSRKKKQEQDGIRRVKDETVAEKESTDDNKEEQYMNGVCYSCSIQCHTDHELVELFSKRNFTCDCGTTRMTDPCCLRNRIPTPKDVAESSADLSPSLRSSIPVLRTGISMINVHPVSLLLSGHVNRGAKADDIPSSSNVYSQNFNSLFCSCLQPYDPSSESGNMIQCQFGLLCNEEWYHEECILGIKPHMVNRKKKQSNNVFESSDGFNSEDTDEIIPLPGFPDLEDFEGFVCWKCVSDNLEFFEELLLFNDICLSKIYHIGNSTSLQSRNHKIDEYLKQKMGTNAATTMIKEGTSEEDQSVIVTDGSCAKKRKIDLTTESSNGLTEPEYSLFLKDDYQHLIKVKFISGKDAARYPKVKKFLIEMGESLYVDEPIYEPPDDDDVTSETSSLYDLGARALQSLPPEKTIQGLQAYEQIKSKLTEFLRPFADKGEIVTEDKIRLFFDKMKDR